MKNVLLINASISGEQGNSTVLSNQFAEQLMQGGKVSLSKRDLNEDSLPHLSMNEMGAWMTPVEERTEEQAGLAQLSDQLIEELKAADLLVLGMPMYNFGIPSTVKVWIDRIARAGVTFKYTEQGPVGLLENKKVIIFAARGGAYKGTAKDTQTQYLKDFFAFIGVDDVEFVYAEGLNMGMKEQAFADAEQQTAALVKAI